MSQIDFKPQTMIYAAGGGYGHAMRGRALQLRLAAQGDNLSLLVIRPGASSFFQEDDGLAYTERAWREVLADFSVSTTPPRRLWVDTFPKGLNGEISQQDLALFSERHLIARLNCDPQWSAEGYSSVQCPYPASKDEWERRPLKATYLGWLVRPNPYSLDPDSKTLAVLDPHNHLGAAQIALIERITKRHGFRWFRHDGRDGKLSASRVLSIGAGYNTVYETIDWSGDVIRFIPLRKRFDDQFRRLEVAGRGLYSLDELDAWLTSNHSATLSRTGIGSAKYEAESNPPAPETFSSRSSPLSFFTFT